MTECSKQLFVYGTLTDPERVASVVSTYEFLGEATLHGLHRVDGRYPTLAPGGTVSGRVLRTEEIEAIDAYEGVESGLYVRVSVPRDASESDPEVDVYVGDPVALGADAEWPGTGSFPERVRRFVRENEVVVRSRE
ncbi:gamma-glutamylcyclotransferase [Halorussus limi]|uniref:Gamma-glutamylcyclotransferase n=1 Tax=Halorussus limi TaxID=2938695 RepID=A0A8U0HZ26_9EURY|nr:gamma-glutamylcyclotransferase family protein [Halorussus limi]UPV75774.1 gamma-glutamylcyclotransferase [Halorussus limi]